MIVIGYTHCLEGICRSLFSFFSWYWPVSLSLHFGLITCCWRVGRSSSIAQLSGFGNMEISFALVLMSPSPLLATPPEQPPLPALGKYICYTSVWEWRSCFLFDFWQHSLARLVIQTTLVVEMTLPQCKLCMWVLACFVVAGGIH